MMKTEKQMGLMLALCVVAFEAAWAHLPRINPKSDDGLICLGTTPLQVGICSHYPLQLVSGTADVYGIAAGVINLSQRSAVVSASLANGLERNYFAQAGLFCYSEGNYAIEFGLVGLAKRNYGLGVGVINVEVDGFDVSSDHLSESPGLQIGLFNFGGSIQIGLLNHNPRGIIPWLPIVNFPRGGLPHD